MLQILLAGPKQQKKFRKLVMNRIKWSEDQRQRTKDEGEYLEEYTHLLLKCFDYYIVIFRCTACLLKQKIQEISSGQILISNVSEENVPIFVEN